MSEASKLYYLNSKKIDTLENQIKELRIAYRTDLKKLKAQTDKELKSVIAKKKAQNKKLVFFVGLLAIAIFAVGVFTDDGMTFNREKISYVLEHVASIVISSSIGGVCVFLFTNKNK